MRTPTLWEQTLQRNPNHSLWYVERMRALAAEGNDLAGEARQRRDEVGWGDAGAQDCPIDR